MALNSRVLEFIVNLKDNTSKGLRAIDKSISTVRSGFGKLSSAVFSLKGAFAGLSAGLIAKSLFDAGTEAQRLDRAFETITGSTAAAKAELGFLRAEADRLGMEFYESADSFKSISAAAQGTALAGQPVKDLFIGLGEAATALGLNTEQTTGALRAFEQMISKGNVQAEELRGQLGERLPGAFQMAARAMGVSTQELNKMLDNGEVLATDLLPKLAEELHKTFGDAAVVASKGAQQELNRLKTAFKDFQVTIANTGYLDTVTDGMRRLTAVLKDPAFQQGIQDLITGLTTFGVKAVEVFRDANEALNDFALLFNKRAREINEVAKATEDEAAAAKRVLDEKAKAIGKQLGIEVKSNQELKRLIRERIVYYDEETKSWKKRNQEVISGAAALNAAIGKHAEAMKAADALWKGSLEYREAEYRLYAAKIDQMVQQNVLDFEKAEQQKSDFLLNILKENVQRTKDAYEELKESAYANDPEEIAKAKAAMIAAETAYVEAVVDLNKDKNDRIKEQDEKARQDKAAARAADLDTLQFEHDAALQALQERYDKEYISFEEMTKKKLVTERDFAKARLEIVTAATQEIIDANETETAAYKEAVLARKEALKELETAQKALNDFKRQGVEAIKDETKALGENAPALNENAEALRSHSEAAGEAAEKNREMAQTVHEAAEAYRAQKEAAKEAGDATVTYIKHVQGAKVEMAEATEEQLEHLQRLSDAYATYKSLLVNATGSWFQALSAAAGAVRKEIEQTERAIKRQNDKKKLYGRKWVPGKGWTYDYNQGGPVLASSGAFIRRPHGALPGVDTGRDYVPVLARGGEWFIRNEAANWWTRALGRGFMPAINSPWSGLGQKIVAAVKAGVGGRFAGGPVLPVVPRFSFASGGGVGSAGSSGAGAIKDMGRLEIVAQGRSHEVFGEAGVLQQLKTAVSRAALMRGR